MDMQYGVLKYYHVEMIWKDLMKDGTVVVTLENFLCIEVMHFNSICQYWLSSELLFNYSNDKAEEAKYGLTMRGNMYNVRIWVYVQKIT